MPRQRTFQTAAARRRQNPIEWIIDGKPILLKPTVDLIDIADLIEALTADDPEGESQIRASYEKRKILLEIIETFIEPGSVEQFRAVEPDLDGPLLSEMLEELVAEYTGQNPTQAPSSSDGQSATGSSSTDGAPLEE